MIYPAATLPVIDSHVHFVHPDKMDDILALMDAGAMGTCPRFNLVCLPNLDGTTQNAAALYFKQHHPDRVYLSGALEYGPALADPANAPDMLAAQVRALRAQGFNGLKLIEGKPQVRKLLPFPLDGPLYAPMWAALAEMQFPVILHIADPDEFWDAARCPAWARQSGWDYTDGSYPTKETLYAEVAHVLARYPGLNLVLAHFYFLSRELERAARLLDAHSNVCFDLAPHMDMYTDFSRNSAAVRAFFLRYQTRILYGTDTDTRVLVRGPDGFRLMQSISVLIRSFLQVDGEFEMPGGTRYHGLGLPRTALENIYARNFERVYLEQGGSAWR